MTKLIPLTTGGHTLVDDDDYAFLIQWRWRYQKRGPGGRVKRDSWQDGKTGTVFMHRVILERCGVPVSGLQVDHRDLNPLNNTRANLRTCTNIQNSYNRKTYGGKSPFKGVSWHKRNCKWEARIRSNCKSTYLGQFTSELDAARAYDKAALEHHGAFARLNFPESE